MQKREAERDTEPLTTPAAFILTGMRTSIAGRLRNIGVQSSNGGGLVSYQVKEVLA